MNEGTILFSYPRSGNTWVRYIFEWITGFPSQGTLDNLEHDPPIYIRQSGIPVDPKNPPRLFKRHTLKHWTKNDYNLPLIVILRNYKECVLRQNPNVLKDASLLDWEYKCYLDTVRMYHEYNLPKMLIYYEDLIQSPSEIIQDFGSFVNAPQEKTDEFLKIYEEHRVRSVKNYSGGSHTLGTNIHYHQEKLSPEARIYWDAEVKKRLGTELFDIYLSRYTTSG